jgi:hypothetical protein
MLLPMLSLLTGDVVGQRKALETIPEKLFNPRGSELISVS